MRSDTAVKNEQESAAAIYSRKDFVSSLPEHIYIYRWVPANPNTLNPNARLIQRIAEKVKLETIQRHCGCDISPDQNFENMIPW